MTRQEYLTFSSFTSRFWYFSQRDDWTPLGGGGGGGEGEVEGERVEALSLSGFDLIYLTECHTL